jgi:hypothetical protein
LRGVAASQVEDHFFLFASPKARRMRVRHETGIQKTFRCFEKLTVRSLKGDDGEARKRRIATGTNCNSDLHGVFTFPGVPLASGAGQSARLTTSQSPEQMLFRAGLP